MVTLQKVHGSENSFFLLDETQLKQPLTTSQLAAFTKQVTNRQTGCFGNNGCARVCWKNDGGEY